MSNASTPDNVVGHCLGLKLQDLICSVDALRNLQDVVSDHLSLQYWSMVNHLMPYNKSSCRAMAIFSKNSVQRSTSMRRLTAEYTTLGT